MMLKVAAIAVTLAALTGPSTGPDATPTTFGTTQVPYTVAGQPGTYGNGLGVYP